MRNPFVRAPELHVAADRGSGPVVVLLHGIASSWVTFQFLLPLIEGRHRIVALDLLGFGESPAPPDASYTFEDHVASVRHTLRSLDIRRPFVLVGHSMGSLIAARYAAEHRRDVSRVVLVSPPICLTPTAIGNPRDRTAMDLYLRVYEFLRRTRTSPSAPRPSSLVSRRSRTCSISPS